MKFPRPHSKHLNRGMPPHPSDARDFYEPTVEASPSPPLVERRPLESEHLLLQGGGGRAHSPHPLLVQGFVPLTSIPLAGCSFTPVKASTRHFVLTPSSKNAPASPTAQNLPVGIG